MCVCMYVYIYIYIHSNNIKIPFKCGNLSYFNLRPTFT